MDADGMGYHLDLFGVPMPAFADLCPHPERTHKYLFAVSTGVESFDARTGVVTFQGKGGKTITGYVTPRTRFIKKNYFKTGKAVTALSMFSILRPPTWGPEGDIRLGDALLIVMAQPACQEKDIPGWSSYFDEAANYWADHSGPLIMVILQ